MTKPKPCEHRPHQFERRSGRWYCPPCGRDVDDEHGSSGLEVGHLGITGCGDPDEIPDGCRYRHPGRKASGTDEERREARYVKELRDRHVPARKSDGRIKMSIPVELFWGKIRQTKDRQYWNDPKNVRRHRNWMVKE